MPREESYRDLIAWQKAVDLANAVYRDSRTWPTEERFGLVSQARRAAVSIPANIAEGQGRLGSAELRHHLSIAHGSLCELETLLVIASSNGLLSRESEAQLATLAGEVGKLLRGLMRSLDRPRPRSPSASPLDSSSLLDSSTPRLLD